MKRSFLFLAIALFLFPAGAEVVFSGLDLAQDDTLLFQAKADMPGGGAYTSLFRAKAPEGPIEQMTFYPEEIQFVDEGRSLQVQNRFGLFRSGSELAGLMPVKGFPSFSGGSQVQSGKLLLTKASPDGRYIISIQPLSAAYGRLVLHDTQSGAETVVSQKLGYLLGSFPALWSPDSAFFVYSSSGRLFYYSIEQLRGKRVPDEKFRDLGPGVSACARWSPSGTLYTIQGRQLFRTDPREFFTRTLYSSILSSGTIVGEVPFAFDPNFDSFEISPSGRTILLVKNNRSIFIYEVKNDDRENDSPQMMPYLYLPSNALVSRVIWPSGGPITILATLLMDGERHMRAFRVADPDFSAVPAESPSRGSSPRSLGSLRQETQVQDLDGVRDIAMSPDGRLFAVASSDSLRILSYDDFSVLKSMSAVSPRKLVWRNSEELALAGDSGIELVNVNTAQRSLIALSQVDSAGWSAESGAVLAKSGGQAYKYADSGAWEKAEAYDPLPASSVSGNYRVYADAIQAGAYKNAIMVRAVKTLKTASLVVPPSKKYAPFPLKDEERLPGVFDHGSRIRRREVALAFDLYDGDEGLMTSLNVLKDYGLSASFFLNGEFIRRYPGAVKDLAASGMELGSMFFANWNLTDGSFTADGEFVKRGLARNEDDYFAVTGKELSAIWHAPYYAVNSSLLAAARSLNYDYIGRDVDPLDWVPAQEQYRYPGMYMDSAQVVERVMERKKPGSIIAVRLGIPSGGRGDYLYNRLDILLNALIQEGYDVVPVSTLMNHAK
jgi:peptidoglycan/xylan/chitin deacetylase (PgdA/CDA1 family)